MILQITDNEKELKLFNTGVNAVDVSIAAKVNINFDYTGEDAGFC
jgi:hypothetical protein